MQDAVPGRGNQTGTVAHFIASNKAQKKVPKEAKSTPDVQVVHVADSKLSDKDHGTSAEPPSDSPLQPFKTTSHAVEDHEETTEKAFPTTTAAFKVQGPPLTADPITHQGVTDIGYAKFTENQEAKRLMQRDSWRENNTAVSSDFLKGYYKNSRLHHLSMWKAELKTLVAEAQQRADSTSQSTETPVDPQGPGQKHSLAHAVLPKITGALDYNNPTHISDSGSDRVIMHIDFDAFFVSCGLSTRPELRNKPVVVCHAQGNQAASSTSEIASCSYESRKFGVKNGMSLGQARRLCEDIRTMP